jgi:hypothetical protein
LKAPGSLDDIGDTDANEISAHCAPSTLAAQDEDFWLATSAEFIRARRTQHDVFEPSAREALQKGRVGFAGVTKMAAHSWTFRRRRVPAVGLRIGVHHSGEPTARIGHWSVEQHRSRDSPSPAVVAHCATRYRANA